MLISARNLLLKRIQFSPDCYADIARIQAQRGPDSRAADASLTAVVNTAVDATFQSGVGSPEPIAALYSNTQAGNAAQAVEDSKFGPGQTIGNRFARNPYGLTAETVNGGNAASRPYIYINGALIPNDASQNQGLLLHEAFHLLGFDDNDLQVALTGKTNPSDTRDISNILRRDCIDK